MAMVTWTSKSGKGMVAEIEATRKVIEEIAYADGYNLPLGKKTYDRLVIVVKMDGAKIVETNWMPALVTAADKKRLPPAAHDAYSIIGGKVVINEPVHQQIIEATNTAIAEAEANAGAEYAEVKAAELAKKARGEANLKAKSEAYVKALKNGLCPKCHTYCYGDCGAN